MTNTEILEMTNADITEQLEEVIGGANVAPNLGPVPWADKLIIGRWYESESDEKYIFYLKAQLSDTKYLFLKWRPVGSKYSKRWVGPYNHTCDGFDMNEVERRGDFPEVQ